MKNRTFDINIDVFTHYVIFVIGDKKYHDKVLKRKLGSRFKDLGDSKYGSSGQQETYNDFDLVVWLKDFENTFEDYGILLHECIHAISEMYAIKGIALSLNNRANQEFMAYATEHLFISALMKLVPAKKRLRK